MSRILPGTIRSEEGLLLRCSVLDIILPTAFLPDPSSWSDG
jgi:hypothetical protein